MSLKLTKLVFYYVYDFYRLLFLKKKKKKANKAYLGTFSLGENVPLELGAFSPGYVCSWIHFLLVPLEEWSELFRTPDNRWIRKQDGGLETMSIYFS